MEKTQRYVIGENWFRAWGFLQLIIPTVLVAQKKSREMLVSISPSSELFSEPLLYDLELSMLESPLPLPRSYFKRIHFPFMSNTCRFTSRDWLFRLLRRRKFVSKRIYCTSRSNVSFEPVCGCFIQLQNYEETAEVSAAAERFCSCGVAGTGEVNMMIINRSLVSCQYIQGSLLVI